MEEKDCKWRRSSEINDAGYYICVYKNSNMTDFDLNIIMKNNRNIWISVNDEKSLSDEDWFFGPIPLHEKGFDWRKDIEENQEIFNLNQNIIIKNKTKN